MANSSSYTPIQQYYMLIREFPLSKGQVRYGKLIWHGEFKPSALSDRYWLKITYFSGGVPQAFIESPKPLPLADGAKRLPHTYDYDNGKQEICLFRPKYREWNASMSIATTIVHWAVQWMYYYEMWLVSGKWLGGGHGNWDAEVGKDKAK